jgi:hypothetical protein
MNGTVRGGFCGLSPAAKRYYAVILPHLGLPVAWEPVINHEQIVSGATQNLNMLGRPQHKFCSSARPAYGACVRGRLTEGMSELICPPDRVVRQQHSRAR